MSIVVFKPETDRKHIIVVNVTLRNFSFGNYMYSHYCVPLMILNTSKGKGLLKDRQYSIKHWLNLLLVKPVGESLAKKQGRRSECPLT